MLYFILKTFENPFSYYQESVLLKRNYEYIYKHVYK
jgi:hypothetical protein